MVNGHPSESFEHPKECRILPAEQVGDVKGDTGASPSPRPAPSVAIGKTDASQDDRFKVHLEPHEDPNQLPLLRRWVATIVICTAAVCVTSTSSLASFSQPGLQREFGVSHDVSVLAISLYIGGVGIGPLLLGPLSEFFGRNAVYWTSYSAFVALNFPVAFAPNITVFLVFRFVTGFLGSAFFSVAGGSLSDMFSNYEVAGPMAVYTVTPFFGPVMAPAISGFVNRYLHWRWTYYLVIIWSFVELVALVALVPETHEPTLCKWKARKLRRETKNSMYWAPIERDRPSILRTVKISCSKPFLIFIYEPMALALGIWASLLLGILYLTFEAFPGNIFGRSRGFPINISGLSFLGIGAGIAIALAFQPLWIKLYRKEQQKLSQGVDGQDVPTADPPPESRLKSGMVGAILVPLGLFWFAFSATPPTHILVPIAACIPFGCGIIFAFTSIFTFLVHAYRPHAASAMSGNSFLRSIFAMIFPLISRAMYRRLGVTGATALLGGLSALMTPIPFVLHRMGARFRQNSRYAT